MSDEILKAYDDRIAARGPLAIKPFMLREATDIPPREWIYGSILLQRYVTVLVAPGGVGKTAWSTMVGVSLACGKSFIGDWVHSRKNVLFCNLEDSEDEFERRMMAVRLRHQIDDMALSGRVWTVDGRARRLVIASLSGDGITVVYPDKPAIIELVKANDIGAIVVDPFVNSHELEENSNPHINAVVRAWAEIAEETGCAVLLVHHTRKGAVAGDIDSGRGASSLIGACRVGLTLAAMTTDEAKAFGVSEPDRRLHIRLDDAKINLARPAEKARWFRLEGTAIGNTQNPDYPNGDNVQALVQWEPPSVWQGMPVAAINEALDAIARGPEPGTLYAAHKRGRNNTRWAGHVLIEALDVTEDEARRMLKAWLASGLLVEGTYRNTETRRDLTGVTVDDSKRPTEGGE